MVVLQGPPYSIYRSVKAVFRKNGLGELDARVLVARAFGTSPSVLVLGGAEVQTPGKPEQEACVQRFVERRLAGEPTSRIIGAREFWSSTFLVTPDVLDPRPDSETLVETALSLISSQHRVILDLGTGTGCLLVSILKERPHLTGLGIDVSPKALDVAQRNARHILRGNRPCYFVASHWLTAFTSHAPFADIIVSNPPYIPSREIKHLAPEVARFDPLLALDGGVDGLRAFATISQQSHPVIKPGGFILLECGYNQGRNVANILRASGFANTRLCQDIAGRNRVVVAGR